MSDGRGRIRRKRANGSKDGVPEAYRTDRINAAMGALRLTNDEVAEKATKIRMRINPNLGPVAPRTVSAVRNGDTKIRLTTLQCVVQAIGLNMHDLFEPKHTDAASTVAT